VPDKDIQLGGFMKTTILTAALLLVASTGPLLAGDKNSRDRGAVTRFTEFAKVTDVRPVYREVKVREPRQQCYTENERYVIGYENRTYQQSHEVNHYRNSRRNSSTGDVIAGSVIGGERDRRCGATIAGAIIGGALVNEAGSGYSRSHRDRRYNKPRVQTHTKREPIYGTRQVERCERVKETRYDRVVQYYDVTYRYQGQTFTTRMTRDPGRRIELQVSVKPVRH